MIDSPSHRARLGANSPAPDRRSPANPLPLPPAAPDQDAESLAAAVASLWDDTRDKVSVDPEAAFGSVDAHALWKRFLSALAAEAGEARARQILAEIPEGPLRAIPACLARQPIPAWRFGSVLEAEAAGMPDAFESGPVLQATAARPGSAEKLAVLCERARRGEDLWHPADPVLEAARGERSQRSRSYALTISQPVRETALEDLIDQSQEASS